MKNLAFFIAMIVLSTKIFAQDTLVKNNGVIIPAYIVASDSSFFSYRNIDSTKNEINLLQRNEVLLVKHSNGIAESYYMNDTIVTVKGAVIIGKVLEIAPEMITVFSYTDKINAPEIIMTSEVSGIHFYNGTKEVFAHDAAEEKVLSEMDYYRMGAADANKYFRTSKGAIAAEVFSGLGTYIYFLGVIPAAIVATHAPENLHNNKNPNDDLLVSNTSYLTGYKEAAKRKKSKDCWKAYACGVSLPIAIVVGAIVVFTSSYN